MCAAPAKTSDEQVVLAAERLIARDGVAALSMSAVGAKVGVRAPSLYKRFPDRDALLDAVAERTIAALTAQLAKTSRGRRGASALRAMARAYRAFAKRSPHLYMLLYTKRSEHSKLRSARAQAVVPVLDALAELMPAAVDRLPAARALTAFLHGFVSMEIEAAFQLGGDVTRAFDYGVDTLLRAMGETNTPAAR
jgi:AcrR family transcriptional regulator